MKKILALFFLFILLVTNTAIGQALRLPRLVHHYLEHCEWDNNSSIIDFLTKHYSGEITHPDDQHNDHENLPFKSISIHAAQIVTILTQQTFMLPRIVFADLNLKRSILDQQDYSDAYLSTIWQPPRF